MGDLAFDLEPRPYAILLDWARFGEGVDGATPRRRPACVIFGRFPRQLRHRVPYLSAYAPTLLSTAIADLMAMPPIRVRRISRPMAARKTCGSCSAGGTRDHRVRVIFRPCRVRRTTSPSAMRCDQRKPISWK